MEVLKLYVTIIAFFGLENLVMYSTVNAQNTKLTQKQKAYILSIKTSITLLCLGIYFNINLLTHGFSIDDYMRQSSENSNFLEILTIGFFSSHLLVDSFVGNRDYHKYMCSLSGYMHHVAYLVINTLAILTNNTAFYCLYLLEELPTAILSIGSFNPSLRNDMYFGITFFLTRLLFHSILTFMLRSNTLLFCFAMLALGLHSYWFYCWSTKYGFKTSVVKRKCE
jgi:hypothetical protein